MAFTTGKKGIKMMIKRISLIAGMMCLLASAGYAEEKIKHLSIKPVPAITKTVRINPEDVQHDIVAIEAIGLLDRIAAQEAVIDDSLYRLAPDTTFYSKTNKPLLKTDMTQGSVVGWQLNAKGEIVKMWKLAVPE